MDCGQALTASFVACRHLIFFWGDVYLCDSGVLFLGLAAFYSIIPCTGTCAGGFYPSLYVLVMPSGSLTTEMSEETTSRRAELFHNSREDKGHA